MVFDRISGVPPIENHQITVRELFSVKKSNTIKMVKGNSFMESNKKTQNIIIDSENKNFDPLSDLLPNWEILRDFLSREGRLELKTALELVKRARTIFRNEKNVLYLKPPYTRMCQAKILILI